MKQSAMQKHPSVTAQNDWSGVRIEIDNVNKVFGGIEALRITVARLLAAFHVGEVLELALTGLVADRTIERMVDEQHLEHGLPRLEGLVGVNVHHLAFSHGRRARGRELGRLLHLDETHPANAGDGKARVVAVMGDQNPRDLCRFEDGGAFRHRDRTILDREIHHLLLRHYATAAVTGWNRRP